MKLKNLFPLLFFMVCALYITFPLIFHMGSWTSGFGDQLLISWIQNWVIHSISTNPLSLFEAPLYFPFHHSLAYSDILITSSVIAALPLRVFSEPIITFNITFISSLFLLGYSVYLLSNYLTKNVLTSILSGVLVIFSPAVLDKYVHVQILGVEWVVFSFYFFLRYVKEKKFSFYFFSLLFFLLQMYNSFMPGYFILFFYAVVIVYTLITQKKIGVKLFFNQKVILNFLFSVILLIPIIIPYYRVSHEFNAVRDFRDTIHFALQPEDIFTGNSFTKLQSFLPSSLFGLEKVPQNAEVKTGYLGIIFTLLSIFSIYYFVKMVKKKGNFEYKALMTTAILGLVLSFGPFLHVLRTTIHSPFPIPLPYSLMYYLLPGFKGFRNSARFEMLFIICVTICISLFLNNFLKKRQRIIVIFLILFTIAEFNFPMHFFEITQKKDFPKEYSFLSQTHPNTSYIVMPIYNWNSPYSATELKREYYSTISFRKSVNGYSGFSPIPWENLVTNLLVTFPSDQSIQEIKSLGVTYILFDKKQYQVMYNDHYKIGGKLTDNPESILNSLKENRSLSLVRQFGDTYIFSFN